MNHNFWKLDLFYDLLHLLNTSGGSRPSLFILFKAQKILVFYLAKNVFLPKCISLLLTCKDTLCHSTIALSLIKPPKQHKTTKSDGF